MPDPAEHEGFALRGFGQLAAVADDADAAGGAACATAAYAGMGYVVAEARLQHAQALRHPHRSAVAVGQADHAAAALVQRACASGQQDKSEQTEIADQEIIGNPIQRLLLGHRADLPRRKIVPAPVGIVTIGDDGSSGLIKAEQGQRRNQHRRREQEGRRALVERFHAKPEVKPNRAVHPGDDQHRRHQPCPERPCDQERIKFLRIELFMPVQRLTEARANDMGDDERRDAQTEYELERLDRLSIEIVGADTTPRRRDRYEQGMKNRTRS